MQANFYQFRNNTNYNPQFTWAVSIHSKSAMVDSVCSKCGARHFYPSGAFDVSVEDGSMYPDVLGCGEYPFLIVSKSVIQDWQEVGIHNFHTYPVGIAEILTSEMKDVPAPEYFRVEIDGRCKIDLKASGLKVTKHCRKCNYLRTEPTVSTGFQIAPGSWDGSSIFRDNDLYPRVSFCTQTILELAGKHKRTNFRFDPMEGPLDVFSRGIDYL